ENLGWRFHRIWSTDWFMRKTEELKRAMDAFQAAVDYADKLDSGVIRNGDLGEQGYAKAKGNGENDALRQRSARPPIPMWPSIARYSQHELVQLIQWIASDGHLRTDDEIVAEMVSVLGFSRRGVRIDAGIRSALHNYRTNASSQPRP